MPIITVSNLKGGTGKTTTVIYLATAMARMGKDVTVLDCDPQGSASTWEERAEGEGGLGFPVMPANVNTIARWVKRTASQPEQWVFIDCQPGASDSVDAALEAADHVIVPVVPTATIVERMWGTLLMTERKEKPAHVLLVDVQPRRIETVQLEQVIEDEEIPVFSARINSSAALRRTFGHSLPEELFGYEDVANELETMIND